MPHLQIPLGNLHLISVIGRYFHSSRAHPALNHQTCGSESRNLRHNRVKGTISSDISQGPSVITPCRVQQTMQQHFLNSICCFCAACVPTPLPLELHSLHKCLPLYLGTHRLSAVMKSSQFILRDLGGSYPTPMSQVRKPRQRAVNWNMNSAVSSLPPEECEARRGRCGEFSLEKHPSKDISKEPGERSSSFVVWTL